MVFLNFLLRLLIQVVAIASLLGIGAGTARLLRVNLSLFEKVALGASTFVIVGRWIGIAGLFTFPVMVGIAIGGLVLAGILARGDTSDALDTSPPLTREKALLFTVPALFFVFGAQSGYWFSPGDDMQGYFPFIQKVIGTGGAGLSQFSDKRQFDLGGIHFLSAPFVRMFDMSAVRMADMGVGIVILFGLLAESARRRSSSFVWCAIVAFVAFELNTYSRVVNSPHFLVEALCVFLFLQLMERPGMETRRAAVIGIVVAAVVSIKLTALPLVAIVLAGTALVELAARGLRPALRFSVIAATIVGISLAPFLWASLKSTGTLLFPVLGLGWQDPAIHGPYVARADGTLWNVLRQIRHSRALLAMLATSLMILALAARRKSREEMLQIGVPALATCVTIAMIIWSGLAMGEHIHAVRYSLPFYSALALWLLSNVIFLRTGLRGVDFPLRVLLLLFAYWCHADFQFGKGVSQIASDIAYSATGSTWLAEKRWPPRFPLIANLDAYRKLQAAVPPGQKMLVAVDRSFLFDFGRNTIETADCPGRVSPPPGIPLRGTVDEMIRYLRGVGVGYVAYSYGNHANYSPELLATRMREDELPLTRYCATGYFLLQKQIGGLKDVLGVVYDDGERYLIKIPAS